MENESYINIAEKESNSMEDYKLFQEVSESSEEDLKRMISFFEKLDNEGVINSYEMANKIREFLIEGGFSYDDKVFSIQDMIDNKKGNCLGLSLLIGSELKRRGFEPEFEIITHPKDAIDKQDKKLFEELYQGGHFDYDKPVLPDTQADFPIYRFAPLEHPSLVLDGKRFETTGLEDIEEAPDWDLDAETKRKAEFKEVASNVYLDKAKQLLNEGSDDFDLLEELARKCLELDSKNKEAWAFLWELGLIKKEDDLIEEGKDNYLKLGGSDSRFYYKAFLMTGDEKFLDKALEEFPEYIEPFMVKKVLAIEGSDKKEAKFNFAVASWCVANSSVYNLKNFYKKYHKQIKDLFGSGEYKRVVKK